MSAFELLTFILFVAAAGIAFTPALVILGGRAVRSIGPARKGFAAWPVFSSSEKVLLALAAIVLGAIAYAYFIEPNWIEVTHLKVKSAKLGNCRRPIRVLQISDLHFEAADRAAAQLPALIQAQLPDLIIFTGDSINSKEALGIFRQCLGRIAKIAPTYAVMGNHDSRCWSDLDLFKGTSVKILNGTSEKIKLAGQEIFLAGVGYDCEALVDQALSMVPVQGFTLFLYHSPDLIKQLAEHSVDLVCAGHTHGGQVCLPFYGAIVTESKFGKQFESGLYRVSKTVLYVNRGIGMEGGLAPRLRFLARPEVTVIDLEPETIIGLGDRKKSL